MADVESNIVVNIDTSAALAELKALQRQISAFHTSMAKSGAAGAAVSANMQQNLINSINSSGKFYAEMTRIKSTTEAFSTALEKNQLTMKEYFRYAGGATKTFGALFKQEHETINKVARENVKTLQTQYIKMGRDASGALRAISVRPLALDMDSLQTKTALAAQKQALLNQLLRQGSTNMLNFGKNTQWAGRQLMVGFTVPLMYFGSMASKTFMELEEQAIRFKRVYGDMFTSGADVNKALKDVQLLANEFTKYGVAVVDTMKMAADVAATGKMGADLTAQVAQATKLAVLGGIDQQKSLDTVISLTSTFGIEAENLAESIDFLNSVENQTILNIDDMTTAIPKAAPVIKQLGGDVKDLAFFMTAFREGGINASEGANALKSGLASIINPTKAAREMLSGFGIDVAGIVNADKGNVKKMVVDLASAFNALDPLNRAQAIEKMFGKFQFARISTLFQNVVKEGSQAQTVLKLTNATTEELAILSERELNKISDSPMYKFKKTVEDLKVSLAPVGAEFLKALTPVVKFFGQVFEKFNGLGEGTRKFVVLLTTIVAGIGPIVLMSFGLLANGVANIIKMFVSVKSIFNGVGKSSAGLGEQTNLLTQQQMENAAVAASLDQAHQKLEQRFTSEAQAVFALMKAYNQAMIAQKAFSVGPMPTGMGKPSMKLADGIISVPGPKGAGDVVPAMLSPGESVIPAKQSAKYAPLVSGIIADSIPGYIKGLQGSKSKTEFAHIGEMTTIPAATLAAQLNQMEGAVTSRALRVINAVAAQFGDALMVNVYGKLGMTTGQTSTGKSINGLLGKPQGVDKSEFIADFDKQGMQRWKASLKAAGLKIDDVSAELTQLDTGIREYLTTVHKGSMINDQTVKQAYDYSAKKMSADSKVVTAFNQLANTAGEARVNISQAVAAKFGLSKVPTAGSKPVVAVGGERIRTGGDRLPFYKSAGFDIVKAATKAIADGAKSALKVASPSKEMHTIGEQGGQGLIDGAKSEIANAQTVGQMLAKKMTQPSAEMPPGTQARNRKELYGDGPVDANAKSLRRQLEQQQRQQLAEAKKQLALDQKISQSKQRLYGTTGEITQDMRIARRLRQSQERALMIAERQRIAAEEAAAAQTKQRNIVQRLMDRMRQKADMDVVMSAEQLARANKIAATKTRLSGISGKLGGAAMGLSMAASVGSMMPGKVGEVSQKLMMPLMALTAILPMLSSAMGLATVTIGLAVASYVAYRMAIDKARDAALDFANKVHGSNEAIVEFGKFAGRVSATEIMDKRREDRNRQYTTVTGKTTFGESYVASDKGKELTKNVGANIGAMGTKIASNDLFRQLAGAVTSGALSTEEARSIAINVGDQLGNQAFGIQVNAKLTELLGPGGENLLKDPLAVRTKMIDETNKDLKASNARATKAAKWTGKDMLNAGGYTAAGAGLGAAAGATVGSMILPVVGTAIGAVIGTVVGAVGGWFKGNTERKKRVAATSGADAALQKIALEEQQQMLDGLEVEYQKKIDIAKASGDIAEADRLSAEYLTNKQTLLDKQAETSKIIMDNFASADGDMQNALSSSADKLMTKKYKGTTMEDVVPLVKQSIDDSAGTKEQKYMLKMDVASGQIDPLTIMNLMDLSAGDNAAFQVQMDIITKFGGKAASDMQQVSDMFIGANGEVDKVVSKKFQAEVGAAKTTGEAQKIIDFYNQISLTGGELDIAYLVDYYQKNPDAAKAAQDLFDKIKANAGNLELNVVTKFMPPEYMGAIDKAYYDKLTDSQKQVYMNEIVTIMSIQDEATFKADPDVQKWLGEPAKDGGGEMYAYASFPVQKQAYAQHLAGIKTEAMDKTTAPPGSGANQGPSKGPDASPLDELIKKTRDLSKATQGLTIGWNASMKAMNALFRDSKGKTKGLTPLKGTDLFNGLENNMRKGGLGQGAIDFLTGLSPEDYKKIGPKFIEIDKKTGKIRLKNAKELNQLISNIAVTDFQNSSEKMIVATKNQGTALNKLIGAGMSVEDAYTAVSDEGFAAAVATGKFTKEQIAQIVASRTQATELAKVKDQLQAVRTYFNDLTSGLKDQKGFSDLAAKLKLSGMDAGMIAQILSDPKLAKGMADQLANGKLNAEGIAKAVEQIRATAQEKIVTNINAGDYAAAFQPGYDAAQKMFDLQQRSLEQVYRPLIKADEARISVAEKLITAKQKEIETQQKLVDAAQKEVDAANKLIEAQNTRNDKLSHDLKLIDHATEAINAKYETQKKALEDVAKANERIANQQKQQLTLADALSSGDIAAAARAVQEIRAADTADALAQQQAGLDKGQQNEIGALRNDEGKTRKQIEEEQYVISEKIYSIQQKELKTAQDKVDAATKILETRQAELIPLEDSLRSAQDALKATQDKLAAEIESLTVMGQTKAEWEDMKLKVEKAQAAQDKLAETQLAGALATAKIVDGVWAGIKGNYDSYKDKTVTITTIMNTVTASVAANNSSADAAAKAAAEKKAADEKKAAAEAESLAAKNALIRLTSGASLTPAEKKLLGMSTGGLVPKYFATGGVARGTDIIPAMLTPGEFIMSKYAVDTHGVNTLKAMNQGHSASGSVYTYNLSVNVKSDSNPDEIARVVMSQIKQIDAQRVRGVRL